MVFHIHIAVDRILLHSGKSLGGLTSEAIHWECATGVLESLCGPYVVLKRVVVGINFLLGQYVDKNMTFYILL
jgi:hypothetical protein